MHAFVRRVPLIRLMVILVVASLLCDIPLALKSFGHVLALLLIILIKLLIIVLHVVV